MLSSSVLQAVATTIVNANILPINTPVQMTPDERPFPFSGQNVVTVFLDDFFNPEPNKDNRSYLQTIKVCITKRVGEYPTDRLYKILYTNELTSLSAITNLITILLDKNTLLSNLIVSTVSTSVNTLLTRINTQELNIDTPLTNEQIILRSMLQNYQIIEPIRVAAVGMQPIPRNDEFFRTYDSKKAVEKELLNDTIEPVGFSLTITLTGPRIMLPQACLSEADLV